AVLRRHGRAGGADAERDGADRVGAALGELVDRGVDPARVLLVAGENERAHQPMLLTELPRGKPSTLPCPVGVIAGLVPSIHGFLATRPGRGWPGRARP